EAIMSINPNVRSVFIKKRVSGELRLNELEHVGGIYNTRTIYKENQVRFVVDISRVYVNISLAGERLTLVKELKDYKRILDAFSGYGAIALNIIHKNNSYVVAGDINIEGLYLAKESINLNKFKGTIDLIHYDAHFLPFRDKSFDVSIGDNPTVIKEFIEELCRVSKFSIIYYLSSSPPPQSLSHNILNWRIVNEYSKNLFIYKVFITCNN
ncbi:MAG: methyltransferase domain-containing protein, partial [Sulfolobaceae archaeon]